MTTTTTQEQIPSPSAIRDSLARDGFVLIPSFYSPSEITRLREAASTVTDLGRTGKWPFIRTLPKQFPPWNSDVSNGIWGVQHLMHPDIPSSARQAFIESYFDSKLLDVVKAIISDDEREVQDEELVMELYNLLVRPDRDFELRWHRDGISKEASPSDELSILSQRVWHTQWNAALDDDSSLVIIPGSHLRASTDAERAADPYAPELEGMKIVHMKAGDIVFYNNNILHRGVYEAGKERMTLHGAVGCVAGGNGRAVNVLQHGVGEWVERLKLDCLEGEERVRAEGMRGRLVELGSANPEVGHIHDG